MNRTAFYRALVVSPTPTWPLNFGNRKRVYTTCMLLKQRGFEIHFVHYASETDWREYMPIESRIEMKEQWDFVDHVIPSIPLHASPKSGDDHLIDEWWDPALENHLRWVFIGREYDVVIVNYAWLSFSLTMVPERTLKILDTHDKFSDRRKVLENHDIEREFFHVTEKEEIKALNRADIVWAIKEEECVDFEKMGTTAEVVTLLHMDEKRTSIEPYNNLGYLTYGFIGASNSVNKVNIENFIKIAEPIFRKYLPPLKLKIAGSVCKDLKQFKSHYMDLIGYVDSVDRFYDDIDVAIVPMDFSTGLKIKAGEALSQSKAVIAHHHAMEGFPIKHELHQCEDLKQLAIEMCQLAYDPSGLNTLKQASIESYEILEQKINETLDQLAEKIIKSKDIIIVLPDQYGDENSVLHWLARSRSEWLGWRHRVLRLSFKPIPPDVQDKDIRIINEDKFNSILKTYNDLPVFHISERIPVSFSYGKRQVFSIIELPSDVATRVSTLPYFSGYNETDVLPGLGHIKIPQLKESQNPRKGLFVIGQVAPLISYQRNLISLLKNGPNELITLFKFDKISDLKESFQSLINHKTPFPRLCVIFIRMGELTLTEQLFLDIILSHNCKTIFLDKPNDLHSLLKEARGDISTFCEYTNCFYPLWEKIDKRIALHAAL